MSHRSRSLSDEKGRPRNFALIIGAMKSGTTSLFHVLSQHPQVAAASLKEPKYFSHDDVLVRGWDWYLSLWDWSEERHRIAIEASPAYTTFPTRPGVPERIAAVKEARFRFIYIMRHPARQIASNVRHTLYLGWGQSVDEGIPAWMIDTVKYAMQLDQYLSVFPRGSVLLLTLEEFQAQPEVVLRRVCTFLDIDDDFHFRRAHERYNAGEGYEIPSWLARVLKENRAVRWITAKTPRALRYRIRASLPRVARRRESLGRHELTTEESRTLLAQLAPDLRRLETTYGVDVKRWWSIDTSALAG